jgi:hypothetical protein
LEVFTVNTYENFYRRIVISTSVLLIAVWLPISAFALDVEKASEDSQSIETRMHLDMGHHCQQLLRPRGQSNGSNYGANEERVGFSETDPAVGLSNATTTVRRATKIPIDQVSVGFAETDPVGQPFEDRRPPSQVSDGQVYRHLVGFAEADPTGNGYQSGKSGRNDSFVACHREGDKSVTHGTPGISDLTI